MKSSTCLSDFASRLREFISFSLRERPKIAEGAGRGPRGKDTCSMEEDRFEWLAVDLFKLQFENNAAYRRFCEARGIQPETVTDWREIPAMPAQGFKELELSSLPEAERTTVFYSSGTTEARSSRHFHNAESLSIYEASLWPWFAAQVLPDFKFQISELKFDEKEHFILGILTPPPTQVPHSSLAHMLETIRLKMEPAQPAFLGKLSEQGTWTLDIRATKGLLEKAVATKCPLLLLGTAFSYVHLLDELLAQDLTFRLPSGSRALETGGYKGRSRSLSKSELYSLITERLGIPSTNIVSEYGMSELSSQAYDREQDFKPLDAPVESRRFRFPPWCRAQIISPDSDREVAEGETGLIRIFDLANIFSVMAIQTEDLGIKRGDGFELIGRAPLAEPRGCSLMAVGSSPSPPLSPHPMGRGISVVRPRSGDAWAGNTSEHSS